MSAMLDVSTLVRRLAAASPWIKIGSWLAFSAAVAGVLQLAFYLLGLELSVGRGTGRTIAIILAFGGLLYLMLMERRPAADYGLVIDGNWSRNLLGGLAIGLLCYGAYVAITGLLGVFRPDWHPFTWRRAGSTFVAALSCMPLAVSQQILFSGYILSSFRDRYSRAASLIFTALLFATIERLEYGSELFSAASGRMFVTMALLGVLLGTLRLRLGSVPLSIGITAGFLMVRRIAGKLADLHFVRGNELAAWFAPASDPRQGPVLWTMLVVAIGAAVYALSRYGETKPAVQTALDESFKRIIPFSHLNALAPLDVWLGELVRARFRVGLIYVPRLLWILTTSTVNTILSWPERLLLPWVMRHKIPDPLFIVGVHRSGTTHLHNLLSLDRQFCTSRQYHILNPVGFLLTGWITTPILAPFMTWKRPMDSMDVTIFSPQEEEFAIAGMCRQSPYWGHTLPQQRAKYDDYIFIDKAPAVELNKWMRTYQFFLRKLTFWSARTPVLKSPYNTGRVGILRKMFPAAKFVHIVRHPHTVYRSNMKLAREAFPFWQLQDPKPQDCYETRFLDTYYQLEEAYYRDAAKLSQKDAVEVHFEDLERDPMGVVRRIYAQLGLKYTDDFKKRLEKYLESIAGYKKNEFKPLPEDLQKQIDAKMGSYLRRWGYDKNKRAA